ncbi:hypothetical protein HanIR_Chr15g0754021 [Helianthus annuus]|nr:hypothetical protein HanIR_Chr15g0754021 [Helianthus annuus]
MRMSNSCSKNSIRFLQRLQQITNFKNNPLIKRFHFQICNYRCVFPTFRSSLLSTTAA